MAEQQTAAALADQLVGFLKAFKDRDGNYRYFERINDMMASNAVSLVVDYIDLDSYNPDLAKEITHKPDEYLEAFGEAVLSVLREIHSDYEQEIREKIRVRIGNYTVQKGLREINADLIDKLVGVSGMVVRSSEIKPLAKKVAYHCTSCGELFDARLKGLLLAKPQKCPKCGEREFEMDPEHSIFIDFQMVRLQELPEDLPAGQLPHYVEVTVMGDLVDQCRPGDRIMLTGIIRIEQEQLAPQAKTSLFRLRMEGNNIEYLGGRAGNKDTRSAERIMISAEDEKQIRTISSKPDAYQKLVASFAPHIYGHWEIKESILLLIVGSVTKKLDDGSTRRGDINVLLVGDPGTAKSEMLKFAAKIAPRGLYTSGRGSTAAGLTAAVIRDKSGIMMLEAGAVVLGDQGLVCMTEDTEIYTGHSLMPVGKLWEANDGDIYLTKTGREAKKVLLPVGIHDNKIRADIDGHAFAILRKRFAGNVIKLTFASGLTLRVTPEHLLRRTTNVKNLWIKAKDVKPGYFLKAPVRVFRPACTLNVAEEEAYVIGCIYGDGYTTTNYITISQSKVNSDIVSNIQKSMPGVFALYDKGDRVRTLGKYVLVSRMFQLHTTDKSLLKRTHFLLRNPSIDNVLQLADKPLWAFFAGVFDTDGDFNHVGGKVVAVRMYPSTSMHELRLLLYALRRVGVYARIHKTRKGFPIIQVTGQDISRFVEGIKSRSAKAEREGDFEIHHKKSSVRGIEKVVKIDSEPYDGYVYDLSVGKYHNYEASLVYIHNCIDEFDKIKPEDRSALHEVMEQQTCSVAKGGIVATLNARTSILSAANPMYGKYDPYKNITENVNLPVPLLTRFDLIFIVRDLPEKEKDNLIASHILEIHKDSEHAAKPAIEIDLYSKYLSYAKQLEPQLTQEAVDLIRNYYMDMRKVESEGMITVTPRQLEGLVRLATARARLLLKDKVEADDATRAIYLVEQMLRTAGVDVNTGKMDVGVLYGKPQSETSKSKTFMDVFKGLSGSDNNDVEEKALLDELVKTGKFTDEGDARKYFEKAKREGQIYERKTGFWAKA